MTVIISIAKLHQSHKNGISSIFMTIVAIQSLHLREKKNLRPIFSSSCNLRRFHLIDIAWSIIQIEFFHLKYQFRLIPNIMRDTSRKLETGISCHYFMLLDPLRQSIYIQNNSNNGKKLRKTEPKYAVTDKKFHSQMNDTAKVNH